MTDQQLETPHPITPPRDTQLPFFAYGSLKPGEPAHDQIKDLLASAPVPGIIDGDLWVRDGLPLLNLGGGGGVQGFVLQFRREQATQAYEIICQFEPRKQYRWQEGVTLRTPSDVRVNVLIGKKLARGRAAQLETNSWTVRDDPVFSHGLAVVRESIKSDASVPFESAPPETFDWPRFFRLQMAYLLLWSAVERYTSLLIGAGLDPMVKVRKFGKHEVFHAAFKKAGISREDKVCDSRDPEDSFALDPSNPSSAVLYYYQVRNNLSHRGKAAWVDGEIVRKSLVELQAIFDAVINAHTQ